MRATTRLYLTADRAALVREHDPRAATLYAAIGDEIPDSAVQRFGLVDGTVDVAEPVAPLPEPILRVTSTVGASVHVAGYAFGHDPVTFAKGDIDEGQLLAMLKEPALRVEAMAFVGDEAKDWIDIPGRDEVIAALETHVAYDLLAGRAHDRVGLPPEPGHYASVSQPPPGEIIRSGEDGGGEPLQAGDQPVPEQGLPTVAAKEAAPDEDKQAAPAPDKEAAPARTKEAKPARGQRAGKADAAKG